MIIGLADKKLSTRTDDFWIAPSASVIGDVQLGDKSSIWFNSTIEETMNLSLLVMVQTFKITLYYTQTQVVRALLKIM